MSLTVHVPHLSAPSCAALLPNPLLFACCSVLNGVWGKTTLMSKTARSVGAVIHSARDVLQKRLSQKDGQALL